MARFAPVVILLTAIGVASARPVPALAQCRLCDRPSTEMPADSADGDVDLRVETGLDFDRLVFSVTSAYFGAFTLKDAGKLAGRVAG